MNLAVQPPTDQQSRRGLGSENMQLVTFRLGNEEYAVEITKVQEIILPGEMTRMPRMPDYVKGLINLRSEVVPVVDLRRRFGLPEQAQTAETRIVVVDSRGKTLGVIVDAVDQVLRAPRSEIIPPPEVVATAGREYLIGLVRLGDRLLILPDVERFLDDRNNEENTANDETEAVGDQSLAYATQFA